MPPATIRQFSGLYTTPNPFSQAPEGALLIADEMVAKASGALESRRGMRPSVQFNADRCFPLPSTTRVLTTSRLNAQPTVHDPDLDTTVALLGSSLMPLTYPYAADVRTAVQAAPVGGNLYLMTGRGTQVVSGLPAYSTTPQRTVRSAGLTRPSAPLAANQIPSSPLYPGVFGNNLRRAYRVTLAMYDIIGNFYESTPSEPVSLDNTSGGLMCPILSLFVPPGLGLGLSTAQVSGVQPLIFFRIWRALEVPQGTQSSDEMFLVGNVIPTSLGMTTDAAGYWLSISTTTIQCVDVSVDSLLSVPLYTNPQTGDGFGIVSANDPPPAGACIAQFKGRTYIGRPSYPQTLQIQIIGTGDGGLIPGDTITIDGLVYLAIDTAPPPTSRTAGIQFAVPLTPGQVAKNIETAARNLVYAINRTYDSTPAPGVPNPGNGLPEQYKLHARYVSTGVNDFGRIEISRIFPVTNGDDPRAPFSASSTSLGFSYPNGSPISTDDYTPGAIAWSKFNQPEAFPSVNWEPVGDAGAAVLGFSVHRDAVIIYKEDGAWILRDDGGPQPSIDLLDASVVAIAPQSIGVINNLAYVLTARGPLQVSEQGTIPIGEPIRADLIRLLNLSPTHLATAYGIGYESERQYILGLPSGASEPGCSLEYVLRVPDPGYPVPALPQWTRWLVPGTSAGCVLPTQNKLAMAYGKRPDGNNVLAAPTGGILVERKGGVVSTDYVDLVTTVANPGTASAAALTFPQDVHLEIFPGDVFTYNPGGLGTKIYTMRVTAVAGAVVTLDAVYPFAAGGTLTYYRAIRCRWRPVAITLGEPTYEKLWEHVQFYFEYIDSDGIDVSIDSEKAPLRPFTRVATDPLIGTGGNPPKALSSIQWLRNCRDVVLRVDPGIQEARGARLGVECVFAQARASFKLTAMSANAGEFKRTATR